MIKQELKLGEHEFLPKKLGEPTPGGSKWCI
jgi:hypothetical protein